MSETIYYIDQNNNYYIDQNNYYYIYKEATSSNNILTRRGIPYIHKEGQFKRAKAIIVKTTNMGPIPAEALLTNAGVPYLTNDKQFIMTTGSQNLTSTSTEDFILYEFLTYVPRIMV